MAKYKNREVHVMEELPHPNGPLARIEHMEPGVSGTEIVPKAQVWVSEDELKNIKKIREASVNTDNEFKVQGKDAPNTEIAPSVDEVKVQKMAEENLKRAEVQAKEREDFQKKYPHAPAGAFEQYQTTKVVSKSWDNKDKNHGQTKA